MAKALTADELRTQPEQELITKLKEAKEELFNLRFQAATGQLESHGRLRAVKHEIARIYTVMRERELGIITFVEEQTPAGTDEVAAPEASDEEEPEVAEQAKPKSSKRASGKAAEENDG
jgi:large subunit ribosomal protein L29